MLSVKVQFYKALNFALQSSGGGNTPRETFIFYTLFPYDCFQFFCSVKFCSFFIWETKKAIADRIRQVVVLYSNDYMGICLGGLSNGLLR